MSPDRIESAVDDALEPVRLPIRCHLTGEELEAAVAAQLEQRAEQGFDKVPLMVLSRVAQIVATVQWETRKTGSRPWSEDQARLGRAA